MPSVFIEFAIVFIKPTYVVLFMMVNKTKNEFKNFSLLYFLYNFADKLQNCHDTAASISNPYCLSWQW